jgi:hypothetical protein
MKSSNNIVKLILAILLFICLADMSYSYFQLVRFIGFIGFISLAYQAHKDNSEKEMITCCILALLFQPFFKVVLGRQLWNVVDVLVGIWLLISMLIKEKKS